METNYGREEKEGKKRGDFNFFNRKCAHIAFEILILLQTFARNAAVETLIPLATVHRYRKSLLIRSTRKPTLITILPKSNSTFIQNLYTGRSKTATALFSFIP